MSPFLSVAFRFLLKVISFLKYTEMSFCRREMQFKKYIVAMPM